MSIILKTDYFLIVVSLVTCAFLLQEKSNELSELNTLKPRKDLTFQIMYQFIYF